jgi:hypothetical protein
MMPEGDAMSEDEELGERYPPPASHTCLFPGEHEVSLLTVDGIVYCRLYQAFIATKKLFQINTW